MRPGWPGTPKGSWQDSFIFSLGLLLQGRPSENDGLYKVRKHSDESRSAGLPLTRMASVGCSRRPGKPRCALLRAARPGGRAGRNGQSSVGAHKAVMATGPVPRHPGRPTADGGWKTESPSYQAAKWQVIFFGRTGRGPADKRVKAACELFLARHPPPPARSPTPGRRPSGAGHS